MTDRMETAESLFAAGKLMEAQAAFWALARSDPRQPRVWSRLGDIAFLLEQIPQAFDFYGNAFDFVPDDAHANLRLGQCLEKMDRPKDALRHLMIAARKDSKNPETHASLAACRKALGDIDGAIDALRNYLALAEHDGFAMVALADLLMRRMQFSEAGELLDFAALLDPDNPNIAVMQGSAALARQETAEAHGFYLKALEIDPAFAPAWFNLGNLAMGRDEFELAAELFAKAWSLAPTEAKFANNLAVAQKELGRLDAALATLRGAINADPGFADAHWNLATVLFLKGEWRDGFEEAEWRWEMAGFTTPKRDFDCPAWDGRPLSGETLLVHAEQGLGDAFHFARYLPKLAELAGRVVCEVDSKQAALFKRSFPAIEFIERGQPLPKPAAHLPLMSAPRFLGFPAWNGPYLKPDPKRVAHWQAKLAALRQGPWVGIAWQGNPIHHADRRRSLGLGALLPLLDLDRVNIASLQRDHGREQLFRLTEHPLDLGDETQPDIGSDFEGTAAIVGALDAVVAPDTAISHLAAAMGKPVCLMLPFSPDWRWGMTGESTPWYPSARLFRQTRPGDWSHPVAAIAEYLRARHE